MPNESVTIIEAGDGLESYLASADDTTRELLDSDRPVVTALKRFDNFMRSDLWMQATGVSGTALILFMNAYVLWLAAARTALGGHAAAVYPLQRTALESACYGLLMHREPELIDVWINRHKARNRKGHAGTASRSRGQSATWPGRTTSVRSCPPSTTARSILADTRTSKASPST